MNRNSGEVGYLGYEGRNFPVPTRSHFWNGYQDRGKLRGSVEDVAMDVSCYITHSEYENELM